MITKFGYGEYVGKAHVTLGLPCQDKALCVCKNGVYVAAVSDGCGSAKNSQMGSAKTVEIVAELFTTRFDEFWTTDEDALRKTLLTEICNGLRATINENEELFGKNVKGSELCAAMDSLDATALFVAVKGEKVIAGMVGDGIVGAIDQGALRILMEEPKFEGLENATWYPWTVFYLSEAKKDFEIDKHFLLRKYYGERFGGFILMSDGVSALVGRQGENKFLTGGTEKIFKAVAEGDNAEKTAKVIKDDLLRVLADYSQSADDCSLAVLVDPDFYIIGPVYKRAETLAKNPLDAGEPQDEKDGKADIKKEDETEEEKQGDSQDKDEISAEKESEKTQAEREAENTGEKPADEQAEAEQAEEKSEAEKAEEKPAEADKPADVAEEKDGEEKEKNAEPSPEKEESEEGGNKEETVGEKCAAGEEKSEEEGAGEADKAQEKSEAETLPAQDETETKDDADEAPAVFGVEENPDKTNTGKEKSEDKDSGTLISKLKKKFRK